LDSAYLIKYLMWRQLALPLIEAAKEGKLERCEELLSSGADPNDGSVDEVAS
jgi:hypothetical protein